MKFASYTTVLLTALLFASPASAGEVVFEYKGSANRTTPEFSVDAPWILDWRVTTEGQQDSAVEVTLEHAGTGVHQGRVLYTKYPGNGVRLFEEGGKFQFRVDSAFATWTLKVEQLTSEEAKLYSPRNKSIMDQ